jgi:hypothetical protein
LKNAANRLKIHSEVAKMNKSGKLAYVHDWQKAHLLKENKLIQAKLLKKAEAKKT